ASARSQQSRMSGSRGSKQLQSPFSPHKGRKRRHSASCRSEQIVTLASWIAVPAVYGWRQTSLAAPKAASSRRFAATSARKRFLAASGNLHRSHPERRKAAALPVQQVTKVELCINQMTAKNRKGRRNVCRNVTASVVSSPSLRQVSHMNACLKHRSFDHEDCPTPICTGS